MIVTHEELRYAIHNPVPGPGKKGNRQLRSLMAIKIEELLEAPTAVTAVPGVTNKKDNMHYIAAGSRKPDHISEEDFHMYIPNSFLRTRLPTTVVGFQIQCKMHPITGELQTVQNMRIIGGAKPRELRQAPGGRLKRVPLNKFKPIGGLNASV